MADNHAIRDFATLLAKTFRSTESGGIHTPHHIGAASDAHIGEVSRPGDIVDVTLTILATAYNTGTVLSDTVTITNAMRVNGGKGKLQSIVLVDKADQGAKIDLVFFRVTQSLGTKNSGPTIADGDALDILGHVTIETTDYLDVGGAKIATKRGIELKVEADAGSRNIFMGSIVTGTPTYVATTDLSVKFGFDW